jgi:hypothetical protein
MAPESPFDVQLASTTGAYSRPSAAYADHSPATTVSGLAPSFAAR